MSQFARGRLAHNFRIKKSQDLHDGLRWIEESVPTANDPNTLFQIAHDIRRLADQLDVFARETARQAKNASAVIREIPNLKRKSEMAWLAMQGITIGEISKRFSIGPTRVQQNIDRITD